MQLRAAFLLPLVATSSVWAQQVEWDKVENIRRSATEIRSIHNEKGFLGAQEAVRICYEDAKQPGKKYGKDLEKCVTQDFVISQTAANVFAQVSPEARRLSNSPDPDYVIQAMSKRIVEGMIHFNVPEQDARGLIALIKEHGLHAFANAPPLVATRVPASSDGCDRSN